VTPSKPEPSALRTWVTVLAFLAGVLIVMGIVGYGVRLLAHANSAAHAKALSH